jgi:hypothetical protein
MSVLTQASCSLVPLVKLEVVGDWQGLRPLVTGSKSLVLRDMFAPEHSSVMASDLFAGTPAGALGHPDYLALHAPRGFLVSYSLPRVAIALGRAPSACPVPSRRAACCSSMRI